MDQRYSHNIWGRGTYGVCDCRFDGEGIVLPCMEGLVYKQLCIDFKVPIGV